MLDRVQARAGREHPSREDALDLALQRDLVDLDERIGIGGLGRRAGVADARRHLQRAELYRLADGGIEGNDAAGEDRKSTRLNSSHMSISYAVFCLKKKKKPPTIDATTRLNRRQPTTAPQHT